MINIVVGIMAIVILMQSDKISRLEKQLDFIEEKIVDRLYRDNDIKR